MSDVATERIDVRVRPEELAKLKRAAELSGQDLDSFVIAAVLERADAVTGRSPAHALARDSVRVEPHIFFAELLSALDATGNPHTAKRRTTTVVIRTVDIRD